MSFQIYSTERIDADLYGGVVAYKIEVRFEHGVVTQRHTYYGENGLPLEKKRWIPSPLTLTQLEEKGSGFFKHLR